MPRTYGFSTGSMAPHQWGSTNFQVVAGTEAGRSRLDVAANGIARRCQQHRLPRNGHLGC